MENYNSSKNKLTKKEVRTKSQFREFIKQQSFLPATERSDEFNSYIAEKIKEREFYEDRNASREYIINPDKTFDRYLDFLDLDINDLKNKRILDLGCGSEYGFVKTCLDRGITQEIYGVDMTLNLDRVDEKYRNHLFKMNFYENLPEGKFDFLLAIGSIGGLQEDVEDEKEFLRVVKEKIMKFMDLLNKNGELRIFSIFQPAETDSEQSASRSWKRWNFILQDLSENLDFEIKPIDIVPGKTKEDDVCIQNLLIIRRKSE